MDRFLSKHAFAFYKAALCCGLVFVSSMLLVIATTVAPRSNVAQVVAKDQELQFGLITTHPEASKVWRDFSERNNYRLTRVEDFTLSPDRYRSYGDGDFNGDRIYNDFAVIVVHKTRTDASRFGLVIFNARNDSKGYDGPFWLYRGVDLSKAALSLISHGPLIVTEGHSKEKARVCVVKWNRLRRSYRCEAAP